MKSLEAIKRENLINHPEIRVDRLDWQDELNSHERWIRSSLTQLFQRVIYNSQLEIFRHFGKTEGNYHKYLEQKRNKEKQQ